MNFNEFIYRVKPFAGKETIKKIDKPWGQEVIWANSRGHYTAKILVVEKGESLSLQYHERKNETMLIMDGTICLTYGEINSGEDTVLLEVILSSGNVINIPNNTIHRIKAITNAYIMEVSTFDDGDVVRLEDKYDRK